MFHLGPPSVHSVQVTADVPVSRATSELVRSVGGGWTGRYS
jgi:hypothetical protein